MELPTICCDECERGFVITPDAVLECELDLMADVVEGGEISLLPEMDQAAFDLDNPEANCFLTGYMVLCPDCRLHIFGRL